MAKKPAIVVEEPIATSTVETPTKEFAWAPNKSDMIRKAIEALGGVDQAKPKDIITWVKANFNQDVVSGAVGNVKTGLKKKQEQKTAPASGGTPAVTHSTTATQNGHQEMTPGDMVTFMELAKRMGVEEAGRLLKVLGGD